MNPRETTQNTNKQHRCLIFKMQRQHQSRSRSVCSGRSILRRQTIVISRVERCHRDFCLRNQFALPAPVTRQLWEAGIFPSIFFFLPHPWWQPHCLGKLCVTDESRVSRYFVCVPHCDSMKAVFHGSAFWKRSASTLHGWTAEVLRLWCRSSISWAVGRKKYKIALAT